jgi:hypothetical protein
MATPSRNSQSQGSASKPQTGFDEERAGLDEYLVQSTQELNEISELANLGEIIDRKSRDWMLHQVDFIVETIGNEDLEVGDEMRSNLLQLLLAIANLNEQIRSQASFDF